MMHPTPNRNALKKATNVSISSDLLQEAKIYKINLSQALEQKLEELLRVYHKKQWLEENEVAIQHHNQRVHRSGTFSDGIRWKSYGSI